MPVKKMIAFQIGGNILATKNQRAQKIWITYVIRITQLTVHKQNCLEHVQSERVGIIK
jgi:hypothetical protein